MRPFDRRARPSDRDFAARRPCQFDEGEKVLRNRALGVIDKSERRLPVQRSDIARIGDGDVRLLADQMQEVRLARPCGTGHGKRRFARAQKLLGQRERGGVRRRYDEIAPPIVASTHGDIEPELRAFIFRSVDRSACHRLPQTQARTLRRVR